MTGYVLDASVAAKWFLPHKAEPLAAEAVRLLDHFAEGRIGLSVPDLFWPEMGNLLAKAIRAGRISEKSGAEAIDALMDLKIPTAPSKPLLASAFSIATGFERSVYDSLYVALAVATDAPLVTADERLANALGTYFPVRWLGAVG